MLKDSKAFSSFSVDDIAKAKEFYGQTLGLDVTEAPEGLSLHVAGGGEIFIYPKSNHIPATFTVLNFSVDDVDRVVDALTSVGVQFEQYDNEYMHTDEKGVSRNDSPEMGPEAMAWFQDPAGNIISVLQGK